VTEATQNAIYGVVGEFTDGEELVDAARTLREQGYSKLEAFTPFPVHGIDEAIGISRSKLGWIVLCCGLTGAATALLLIWWTGAVNYPLVIGGKPLFAVEFSIPITFELTVLFSAFGAVFGMFGLNRLPRLYHPVFNFTKYQGATDDHFLLAIEATDSKFDREQSVRLLRSLGAKSAEVVEA
jgi:hypothetical protein